MTNKIANIPHITAEQNIEITPTITASTYTAGFQLGGLMTLAGAVRYDSSTFSATGMLTSVTIVDQSLANAAIDIFLFKASPTIASSDHAALSISDSEMAAKCIGVISVGATYSSNSTGANTNAVTTTSNINLPVFSTVQSATAATQANTGGSSTIYAVAKVTATTSTAFASTTGLKFIFNFLVD